MSGAEKAAGVKAPRLLRAMARALRLFAHVGRGLWIVWRHFPRLSESQQQAWVQTWAAGLLSRVGVQLKVHGQPPQVGPLLLVSNHLSWLDIPVLHAARHCRFVAKSDVRHWPLVGRLATAAGTLYIERGSRRDALRMVQCMQQALEQQDILAVFPEGTTGDGRSLLPFYPNLLQAALQADAPILPLGLRFVDGPSGQVSHVASYVGDETLVGSIWRTLMADGLQVVVSYGVAQTAQGRDRRQWALDLHAEVDRLRQQG